MLYPLDLSDALLLKNFRTVLPELGYRDFTFAGSDKSHQTEIIDLLDEMLQWSQDNSEFSIFSYAAVKPRAEGEDDVLFKLWRTGLVAALHVLKRHDRRENPSRHDNNVTPPLTEELVTYYRKLREYEPLLYASDPRYRDHFVHVLRVWMLGIVVAMALDPEKALRLSLHPGEGISPAPFSKEERFAVYTVAALTHDMGYPIEKVFKLNKSVGEMFAAYGGLDLQGLDFAFSAPHHQMAQDTMKLIASKPRYFVQNGKSIEAEISKWLQDYAGVKDLKDYQEVNGMHEKTLKITFRSQWKYFQKYARALERNQHGFLSTLLLQRKLLFFREGEFALEEDYEFGLEEARQFIIRREILRAVATHTCPDIYFMSAISPEALLFFCDEIQDWGRPRFQQLYSGEVSAKSVKVILKEYCEHSVSWETIIEPETLKDFAEIVFGIAYNLYTRLRSAPDSRRRTFSLCWTCIFRSEAHPIQAVFEFVNQSQTFRFEVCRISGRPASGMEFLDYAATGAKSIAECRRCFIKAVDGTDQTSGGD
jgi:hypothetical protein